MAKPPVTTAYDESSIKVLKGLEPVQQRPGMYTRTDAPNHIMQEVIDNAQDEALAGFVKNITVTVHEDGSVAVQDDGRGIPTGIHPGEGVPTVEVIFTRLHSGGKFDKGQGQAYGFTGGLHGVGVSVTNALSSRLAVTVWREGYEHNMAFENGAVVEPLTRKKLPADEKTRTGTRVQAWPNPKYFDNPSVQVTEMERLLLTKAVLMPGVRLMFERPHKAPLEWYYPGGIVQYLQEGVGEQGVWLTPIFRAEVKHQDESAGFQVGEGFDLAMGWLEEGRAMKESFVNLIPTVDGGRHESGLQAGLLDAVRTFAERHNLIPKGVKIEGVDVVKRVSFVLSTMIMDPQFQGQTKDRLNNKEAHTLVSGLLRDALELWLNDHLDDAKKIVEVAVQEAVLRSKASTKTERRKGSSATVLPGKLTDCENKDVETTELFLVEGDSAGGCFVYNTITVLSDGRLISLGDMVMEQAAGQRHFGYTNDQGVVRVVEFLHARRTKKNAALVEVRLNHGKTERCTPDHLFMLNDGTYARADSLLIGQRLMPLTALHTEGVWTPDFETNHTAPSIVAVTALEQNEDVYDLEVPGTHNFALASGIFVHNSAKTGRDRKIQAILPLRGKLLNTWEVDSDGLSLQATVGDIAVAIGVEPHPGKRASEVDMTKLRYGRICIMADADVDGQHIQVLLLTLFFKHFPALVETQRIWIAQSPLFRVDAPPKRKGGGGKDRRKFYALDDKELKEIERVLTNEGLNPSQWSISRFKGLGEMNADQLWETTMNPESRRMLMVTLEDMQGAEVVVGFDLMMGKNNADQRKEWMRRDGASVEADT